VAVQIRQGIDITSIQRMKDSIRRGGPAFLKRIFSAEECTYCESKRMKYEHYAARFSAKEALLKALPLKKTKGFQWKKIQIKRQATGKPYIELSGATRDCFGLDPKAQIELSMAHEREYAIATVLVILPE